MSNQDSWRALFPHIEADRVHLNHAGSSPLNRNAIEIMHQFNLRQSEDPGGSFPWFMELWAECRTRLASMMGVEPENLALTKNTAHGVSIIANALDWQPGDEIIFANCEYPANSYPWLAQAIDRGVVCKIVKMRDDKTLSIDDFAQQMTSRTRVIALSWIQYSTGFRADLKEFADLAHSENAFLVVDVIQGLGAFPINLSELGVDAAATGSQKWAMGPMGVGGLFVSPKMLDHMRLVNVGALSVNNVAVFDTLNLDVKPNVQRYEEGTPNLNGYAGLSASLKMLDDYGIENAAQTILALNAWAADAVSRKGYIIDTPMAEEVRSGILMFHHPTLPSDEVASALGAAKVHVAVREGRVRFAPHFYMTHDDMERAVDALPAT